MNDTIYRPIVGPAAWRGEDLAHSRDWIYQLPDEERLELETVAARFLEDDPDLRYVPAEAYPLSHAAAGISVWLRQMEQGFGFVLVRGLRTHLYSDALAAPIFYLIGLHMGEPIRQNELGDTFDHVRANTDKTTDDPTALGSRTTDRLSFHSDSSDIVGLLCLRPAQEGGASVLISGATVYNELLERRPDLVPLMFEDWHWDWYKQDHDAPANTYVSPMASLADGVFSIYAGSRIIRSAQDYPEVPRLKPERLELLDVLDEIFSPQGCRWRWISGPATSSGCSTIPRSTRARPIETIGSRSVNGT